MPRKIKGFVFQERIRDDAYEEMVANKTYIGLYKEEDIKILELQNQYGTPYTDYYLREGAKPINKMVAKIGSSMRFEPIKKGKKHGKTQKNKVL